MADILLGIGAVLVGLLLVIHIAVSMGRFSRQRRYIDMEIGRTTGEEQKKWRRRRRRLWRIFLPRL